MTGKQRMAAALAAALGMVAATTASAENTGLYFGLTGGTTSVDMGGSRQDFDENFGLPIAASLELAGVDVIGFDSSLDDSDIGWGLQVGYRFNRYIAAEVGYVNLGDALYEAIMTVDDGVEIFPVEASVRFKSSGPTAAVLGILPIGERFDAHLKGGIYVADTRLRSRLRDVEFAENVVHDETKASETEFFFGVGGAWNINESYSLRVEYQRYLDIGNDDTGEGDVDLIGVSVLFR
jgi:opacity protein-like surface antigen